MVSLTHQWSSGSTDCDDATGWAETESSLTCALSVDNSTYFKLEGTPNDAGNEYALYEMDSGISVSTNLFPSFMIRWKTSASGSGLGAQVKIVYDDASSENLLESSGVPQYSTAFTLTTGTLAAGKTVDKIQFLANDYPDSVASGTYQVYYDFLLFYSGAFTLPNTAYGLSLDLPPKEAIIGIPGRDTDVTQNLGTENAVARIGCDLTQGNWKRSGDTIDGEVFLEMWHERSSDPWQWLDTGEHQFKVTVHPTFNRDVVGRAAGHRLDLVLKEYSLGDKSEETYAERFGIGL